jgi:hypothetical protein
MNIPEDVINHITTEKLKENFVYHREWFTAAVLTQTYTYMIENGLKYSKLVTGKPMFSFWLRKMRHIRLTITSQNPISKPKRRVRWTSCFVAPLPELKLLPTIPPLV